MTDLPDYRLYFDPAYTPDMGTAAPSPARPAWVLDGYEGEECWRYEGDDDAPVTIADRAAAVTWATRLISSRDVFVADWHSSYSGTPPVGTYQGEVPVLYLRTERLTLTLIDGDIVTYTPGSGRAVHADVERIAAGTGTITYPSSPPDVTDPAPGKPAQTYRIIPCRSVVLVDVEVFFETPTEVPR